MPHRAIILLGAVLTVVSLMGATLGIVNADGAEQSLSQISNRYLVLQPSVREIRASISAFQVLAAQAFGGASIPSTEVATAVADSSSTDRAYIDLQRLQASGGTAGLSPGLAAQMTNYVNVRSKLGAFLAGEPSNAQTAQIAVDEQNAETQLDATLASLQAAITSRLTQAAQKAGAAARDAQAALLWSVAIGVTFAVAVTTALAAKAMRSEHESARSEALQLRLTRRNEFESRLQRALEMSKSEEPVFGLVAEALADAAPDMHSELLLADSSKAHFRQVLVGSGGTPDGGCGVVSPDDCPSASRGQTMIFPSSTAIDACPNLRGRGCSAMCVPVSISGSSIGVFHVTAPEGMPPSSSVRGDVEVVARRASERLAMLRAFALSQTQANSDSLTGLMTRRSLERGIRELQNEGGSYSVAYGDLDHFKELNDVFGHDAGDRALRAFSQVLRDSLRPADIASRYGGEEFVIVLPGCPVKEALVVLGRVRQRMAERLVTANLPVFTVSFGVATSDQGSDFQEVVNLADQALLIAKSSGRDQVVVASGAEGTSLELAAGDPSPTGWDASSLDQLDPDGLIAASHGIGSFIA